MCICICMYVSVYLSIYISMSGREVQTAFQHWYVALSVNPSSERSPCMWHKLLINTLNKEAE